MLGEYTVQYGEVIGYVLVGVIAFIGLAIVQLMRRRSDVKKARVAVRLATYSIAEPRVGPVAVSGSYHQFQDERYLDCRGQRVVLDGPIDVQRGTRARWQGGVRTYSLLGGDKAIAIGIMSKSGDGWRLKPAAGEEGVQLFAHEPKPAPPPLLPWRAPLILAIWGAIAFGALVGVGSLLVDVPRDAACDESAVLRLQISAALPQAREQALAKLARCGTPAP